MANGCSVILCDAGRNGLSHPRSSCAPAIFGCASARRRPSGRSRIVLVEQRLPKAAEQAVADSAFLAKAAPARGDNLLFSTSWFRRGVREGQGARAEANQSSSSSAVRRS